MITVFRNREEKTMQTIFGMNEMQVGDAAVVYELQNPYAMRKRLQDLGLVERTVVECVGKAPGGELCAYLIRGAVIAIRAVDAKEVKMIASAPLSAY